MVETAPGVHRIEGINGSNAVLLADGPDGQVWFTSGQGMFRFDGQQYEMIESADGVFERDGMGSFYFDPQGLL